MSKATLLLSCLVASAAAAKPMFQHVVTFSIDGFHQSDIAKYLAVRPKANMGVLLETAYEYTDCYTSAPSDSFPGTVAQYTGGTPKTTGIWYDDTWDYDYWSPSSNCSGPPGANVLYDETIDYNSTEIFSGGIDPANLPQTLVNGVCTPIHPHKRIRVNTVFEVLRSKDVETAYTDKHPAYDVLRGPSGTGLTTGYFPEQAAAAFPDNIGAVSVNYTIAYDDYHKRAFLDWLDAKTPAHSEGSLTKIPTLMGGNFQAYSVAEKQVGYLNTTGLPLSSSELLALDSIDCFFGEYIAKLKSVGIYKETLIIVASKHGQAPINPALYGKVDPALITAGTGVPVAWTTADDIALLWLNSSSDALYASTNLFRQASALQISKIYVGANLTSAGFGDPLNDTRIPDLIVQPNLGIIYTTSHKKIAEHGGLSADDRHVACFASNPSLKKRKFGGSVATAQVAPTVLKVLGFEPEVLQAVQVEGTKVLPGF